MINIRKRCATKLIHITKFNISEYKYFTFSNRKCKLPDFCPLQHRVKNIIELSVC